MRLFADSIGRKAVMATTGLLMVLFVTVHLLGNMTIFAKEAGINVYAEKLQALTLVVWANRALMGTAVVLHIVFAIVLTLENWKASPTRYAIRRSLQLTLSGKTMIWSGLALGAFVGYHVLQFTVHATPGVTLGTDAANRPDVFTMVYDAFRVTPIALIYVVGMLALFLHLSHGVQSLFQSLGLNNAFLLPRFERGSKVLSIIFLIGFGAIPVTILFGILAK